MGRLLSEAGTGDQTGEAIQPASNASPCDPNTGSCRASVHAAATSSQELAAVHNLFPKNTPYSCRFANNSVLTPESTGYWEIVHNLFTTGQIV